MRHQKQNCCQEHHHTHEHTHHHTHAHEGEERRIPLPLRLTVTLLLLVTAALSEHLIPSSPWLFLALAALAYSVIAYDVAWGAVKGLMHGSIFDETFLMTLSSVAAFWIGEPLEAVALLTCFQFGEWFSEKIAHRSRQSVKALLDIRPETATRLEKGMPRLCPARDISVGDLLLIKPGERIPLDGTVIRGEGLLDTSALTGEALPREVSEGDALLSGCINLSGELILAVSAPYEASTVTKILNLVEEAAESKAGADTFIHRFAKIYTPAVVAASLLLAFLLPLFSLSSWEESVYRALSFLVVSCPCALVIAVPLTFFSGIGAAAAQGILVKGANHLEEIARADTFFFDKTGTLTDGVFRISEITPAQEFDQKELLSLASAIESHSSHPIAKAIAAEESLHSVSDIQERGGMGLEGFYEGQRLLAGNVRLLEKHGIVPKNTEIGGTVVHFALSNLYIGSITVADAPKSDAAEALMLFKKSNKHLVMLTGDTETAAERIASRLPLSEVRSGLLPDGKVACLEEAIAAGKRTVFCGDGINDAPVLARAHVGIAMGGLGSDAAIEAADIVLTDDRLSKLPTLLSLAKRTVGIARQNIIFPLAVKGAILLLALFGISSLPLAAFGDVGTLILAVLNASRAGIEKARPRAIHD